MTKSESGVVRVICLGLSLLAAASCSVLGSPLDPLAAGDTAKPGEVCVDGKCNACPEGQTVCNDACYATAKDPLHCGSCTNACKAGEVCADGRCASSCPAGQKNCGASCADTQTDMQNCGDCGVVCGATDECVEGKCVIACKAQLHQPTPDPWGWTWDGLERAASTLADARSACEQFRGRLPTASELYRVSAPQSAAIGNTIHTTPLWSLSPVSPGVHVRVRLSDAAISSTDADTTKTNYRCVCPPPAPASFTGNKCFGAPDQNACAALGGEGGLHVIDTRDRAPVPKTAAVWECSFFGGHLATALQLAEGIQQNIGPGSGKWLHTAEEIGNDQSAFINWTDGKDFVFDYKNGAPNSMVNIAPTEPNAFRCVGETAVFAAPQLMPDQWSGTGRRNIDEVDQPAALMVDAIDQCFARGGHLPPTADLNELILQGAPNGSGAFIWTSDQAGGPTTVTKWTGMQRDHLYGGADQDWANKNESRPYRCVYYAVDPAYAGPPAASCSGGCMEIASPGTSGAKSWFDSADRQGVTVTAAIDTCRQLGGHLPTERDLTEAIRHGLPNGSDVYIATSDGMIGGGAASLLVGTVKWKDTMLTFDDAWGSRSNWDYTNKVIPYRCMWTNELR